MLTRMPARRHERVVSAGATADLMLAREYARRHGTKIRERGLPLRVS